MGVNDLARFVPLVGECLNYLHFGESLATLTELLKRTESEGEGDEADLVARLRTPIPRKRRGVADAADVLRAVAGPGGRVTLARFRRDVDMSLQFRKVFRSLGCRGFSFRLREEPHFRNCGLCAEVNLKVALIADRGLYYPPAVRQGLPAAERQNRHVEHAIGWLLVMEKTIEGQRWWYVVNVQSDLLRARVNCLKIFRGWQRVLFRLVVGLARQRGVTAIAIPSSKLMAELDCAEEVARRRDRAWQGLYDGVAEFFAMNPSQQPFPTNLQPVWFSRPAWCSRYYVGHISALIDSFPGRSADERIREPSADERVVSRNGR